MASSEGSCTATGGSDIKEYAYEQLKSGKYKIKNSNGTYKCPFCVGKRREEYRYGELLQHASGARKGASRWSGKQKAEHLALEEYLEKDICGKGTIQGSITEHEMRKIEEEQEMKEQSQYLLSVKKLKATKNLLKLQEKQMEEKRAFTKMVIKLKGELYTKQKLECEVEELRGKLKELDCPETERGVSTQKDKKQMKEELRQKMKELEASQATEDVNFSLIDQKEHEIKDYLQTARKHIAATLTNTVIDRPVGIKRLGELSLKPFEKECMNRYITTSMKMAQLLRSEWQEYIQDPTWNPFKVLQVEGKADEEILDEEDEKLRRLRDEWGKEVYVAVATAIKEVKEYDPSGRSIVSEFWNFEEGRKATTEEVVAYLREKREHIETSETYKGLL